MLSTIFSAIASILNALIAIGGIHGSGAVKDKETDSPRMRSFRKKLRYIWPVAEHDGRTVPARGVLTVIVIVLCIYQIGADYHNKAEARKDYDALVKSNEKASIDSENRHKTQISTIESKHSELLVENGKIQKEITDLRSAHRADAKTMQDMVAKSEEDNKKRDEETKGDVLKGKEKIERVDGDSKKTAEEVARLNEQMEKEKREKAEELRVAAERERQRLAKEERDRLAELNRPTFVGSYRFPSNFTVKPMPHQKAGFNQALGIIITVGGRELTWRCLTAPAGCQFQPQGKINEMDCWGVVPDEGKYKTGSYELAVGVIWPGQLPQPEFKIIGKGPATLKFNGVEADSHNISFPAQGGMTVIVSAPSK